MDIEPAILNLAARLRDHREILLMEEAAKTSLVMPFLQALGYDVFNPLEVKPEFTADVGTKKGEKVDYAICVDGTLSMLIECKPASIELSVNHASQLFRYFATTEARIAVLTNGAVYKFFSDVDQPNVMDQRPFFTFDLLNARKADFRQLASFARDSFDIEAIVKQAGQLKTQTLIYAELKKEFAEPSEDFVRMIAARISEGRLTAQVKETYASLIHKALDTLIRDRVQNRLESAISSEASSIDPQPADEPDEIHTTLEEIEGYHIVKAIGSRVVSPERIVMRDAKSYCAILLDDNNRKSLLRLHFNSPTSRYIGTFSGKDETRIAVEGPNDIYQHEKAILDRIAELDG